MKMGDYYHGFTCFSRQEYYSILRKKELRKGIEDKIRFGIYHRKGGCDAEMCMTWNRLKQNIVFPKLEVFSDAFGLFLHTTFDDVFKELSKQNNQDITPDEFSRVLIQLGFEDMSDNPLECEVKDNE